MSHQVNTIFEDIFPTSFLLHNNQMTTAQGVLLVELEGLNFKFEVLNTAGAYPLTLQYAKTWNNIPTTPSYFSNCNNANIAGISIPKKFLSGDFNGDGLTDIVAINKAYRVIDSDYEELVIEDSQISYMACRDESHIEYTSKVNFINLDRRLSGNFTNEAGQLQVYYDDNDKLSTGDFDGDGKTDIFHLKQGKIFVYTLDAQNNLKLLCTQNDSRINLAYQPLFGDYNGDGKTDLMFPMGNPSVLFATCMSTGVAFNIRERNMVFSTTTNNWNPQTGVLSTSNLVANDIDGDGKTDILKYFTTTQNGQSTGNLSIYIYHNMGMSLDINAPFFSNGAFIHRTVNLRHYPIPLFLSNDKINTSLEFGILSDNSVQLFNFTKDIKKESQLNNIIQDGVTYEIEYKNLVQSFMNPDLPIYQPGYGQIYPFIDIEVAPSFKVVSKLKRIFNNQQLQQVFGYEAAVSHVTGLGFLGFGKTIKSNWHLNASDPIKLFNININNPQLRGTMVQSFSAKSSYLNPSVVNSFSSGTMADYINRTAYSYNYNLLPNGVFNLQADTVKSKDLLNGTHTTINYTYDSYRNIIKEESNFSGIGTKTTEITYANSPTGTYFIGRPLT